MPWRRSKWFETSCCPPNVARALGLLTSLIYSTSGETIAIHLFVTSTFTRMVYGEMVTLSMDSGLPWEGSVKITVKSRVPIKLAVRIPFWGADRYQSSTKGDIKDGYLYISIAGDSSQPIEFNFPTEPRFVYAHAATRKDEVAITRGPLVYCAESPDNEFNLEATYALSEKGIREVDMIDIGGVNNVPVLEVRSKVRIELERENPLYTFKPPQWDSEEKKVALIPYFLRMNRGGNGAMRVWLKELWSLCSSRQNE